MADIPSEDILTGFVCQYCNGQIIIDSKLSNQNWHVYKCVECGNKSPLSLDDLKKVSKDINL